MRGRMGSPRHLHSSADSVLVFGLGGIACVCVRAMAEGADWRGACSRLLACVVGLHNNSNNADLCCPPTRSICANRCRSVPRSCTVRACGPRRPLAVFLQMASCCLFHCWPALDEQAQLLLLGCPAPCSYRRCRLHTLSHPPPSTHTEEIDYINEGRNADRFRRNFRGESWVRVPRVYWQFRCDAYLPACLPAAAGCLGSAAVHGTEAACLLGKLQLQVQGATSATAASHSPVPAALLARAPTLPLSAAAPAC